VLRAAIDSGLEPTVITLDPHPRIVLGNRVDLISTLERRLELLAEAGVADALVAAFTPEFMRLSPTSSSRRTSRRSGRRRSPSARTSASGTRGGHVETLAQPGSTCSTVEEVEGVSSSADPDAVRDGDLAGAAAMLGRPFELDGTVVAGDQRGGTLGYPTANIAMDPQLSARATGSTPARRSGTARRSRSARTPTTAAPSAASSRSCLDFDGDLYGKRLVVELWARLRDEEVFESEEALIAQIARDVEATRAAVRPA
jgi:riboflavin kinase/FMN adenylyltransferase